MDKNYWLRDWYVPREAGERIKRTRSIDKLEIEFQRKIEWRAAGEKSHTYGFNAYKWDCVSNQTARYKINIV